MYFGSLVYRALALPAREIASLFFRGDGHIN
jgi:hypothetical protein